jgi:hypothetical protein
VELVVYFHYQYVTYPVRTFCDYLNFHEMIMFFFNKLSRETNDEKNKI